MTASRSSRRRHLPRGPVMFAGAVAAVVTLAGGGVYATTAIVSNTNPFSAGSTNVDAGCDTDVKVEERVSSTSAQGTFPTSGAHLSDISADCDGQLVTLHAVAADGNVLATTSGLADASGNLDLGWNPEISDAAKIDRHALIIRPTDARIGTVTISGDSMIGARLTAQTDAILGRASYQWQRSSNGTDWQDIAGATNADYTVGDSDGGQRLRVKATATTTRGSTSATSSATSTVTGTTPTIASVTLSGTAAAGQQLTATVTGVSGAPAPVTTIRWQRSQDGTNWADIADSGAATYTVDPSDYGFRLRAVATATNSEGRAELASEMTGTVAGNSPTIASASISGTTTVGQTLTADAGATTGTPSPTVSYTWQRSSNGTSSWTDIAGATNDTYMLVAADYNNYVRAVATASNAMGSASANSSASAKITATTPTIASASISGTTAVGRTLTATSGATTGNPTPTVTYKWQRSSNGTSSWTDITGATSSTYVLTATDYNKYVRSVATATNVAGSASANSSASAKIAGSSPTLASVTINANVTIGQTITATAGATTGTPTPTVTYKWERGNGTTWTTISGATSSTYTLVAADKDNKVRVTATATNTVGSDSKTAVTAENIKL